MPAAAAINAGRLESFPVRKHVVVHRVVPYYQNVCDKSTILPSLWLEEKRAAGLVRCAACCRIRAIVGSTPRAIHKVSAGCAKLQKLSKVSAANIV